MYLVGKVKTVYTDGPSWDPIKLCFTKGGAIKACLTEAHCYIKVGFFAMKEDEPLVHPRLVTK